MEIRMTQSRINMDPAEERAYREYALRRELRESKEGRKAVRQAEALQRSRENEKRAYREAERRRMREESRKARTAQGRKPRGKSGFAILKTVAALAVLLAVVGTGTLVYAIHSIPRYTGGDLPDDASVRESVAALADTRIEDYQNIALFGVDSRSKDLLEGNNRSDTIMIMSIHRETGEAKVVSVYRDTVLDVGGGYYTKCNAAYAYGGPAQSVKMLNDNLDLNITDFISIGFEGLADAIDALGGIELEITEEEAEYINKYVNDMSKELGTKNTPVPGAGRQTLNGIQATAYCRIRYTAGDDFKRAQRQRTVLKLTFEKASKANPITLYRVISAVKKEVTTSLSDKEMTSLLGKLSDLSVDEMTGFPREEGRFFAMIDGQDCIVPDTLETEVIALHADLFGQKDYKPSAGVRERSAAIARLAGR